MRGKGLASIVLQQTKESLLPQEGSATLHRLPREAAELSSLEVSRQKLDKAMADPI